jgi:hypothetical protein
MSQTYFSKQDPSETLSRLSLLGSSGGVVTCWVKGTKEKTNFKVLKFDKERMELMVDSQEKVFPEGTLVLCTFELRGMNFFSEVIFQVSVSGYAILHFKNILFKSERRTSFRLLTYPIYNVWAEFNLGKAYQGGVVIDFKTKSSQTGLFNNFLKLVGDKASGDASEGNLLRIRIQDLSTTGMALHVSDLENKYFHKETIFQNVNINFKDEIIVVPEVKVVYTVDYISPDKNLKQYKIGLHFENLPTTTDELIGKKINTLLRNNDFNKDFENFLK